MATAQPNDHVALAQYYYDGQIYPFFYYENNTSLEFDQIVKGNGFFSSYRFAYVPDLLGNQNGVIGYGLSGVSIQHRSHGSGIIDNEYKISGYNYNMESSELLEDYEDEDELNVTANPFIQTIDKVDMKYSPVVMSLGNRHYSNHPIYFNSLLGESTCVKNLGSGTLMQNKIDYARGLEKELEASADRYGRDIEKIPTDSLMNTETWEDIWNISMKLNETVTEGTGRISVLKLAELPNFNDTEEETGLIIKKSKPDIEVDEIYRGTFNIFKNMSISSFMLSDQAHENWIPCCFEGWYTMPPIYQRKFGKDTKGIFDCKCHQGYAYGIDVPLINESQFHNV